MLKHMESGGKRARRDQLRLYPRPAFGLRPWFALLRRARSLRRFAFAMPGRVPGAVGYRRVPSVTLACSDWQVRGVVVATTFRKRLLGIHSRAAGGLLVHATSVHGVGLAEPLHILHLSDSGVVVGHGVLAVGGLVRADDYWVLETPIAAELPPLGAQLRVLPSSLR